MTIMYFPWARIKGRFIGIPLPPSGTFDGQTILVTGGSSGIGFAAAVHFARLGGNVIITSRSSSRGEAAKALIQKAAPTVRVTYMELNMAQYSSCVDFVAELKKSLEGFGGLDVAVLNAGGINPLYATSPDGWEMTIQVNALSTTLLGLLLVDWMKAEQPYRKTPAHLLFVTSRDHLYANIHNWAKLAESGDGLLRHFSDRKNFPSWWQTTTPNYDVSKLLVTYAIEKISRLALGPDGEPQVVVNSLCTGNVRTEIGRPIAEVAWFLKIIAALYVMIVGKSPDHGARHVVKASLLPKETHGQFYMAWMTHDQYLKTGMTKKNITCDHAKRLCNIAWSEIVNDFVDKVPAVRNGSLAGDINV